MAGFKLSPDKGPKPVIPTLSLAFFRGLRLRDLLFTFGIQVERARGTFPLIAYI